MFICARTPPSVYCLNVVELLVPPTTYIIDFRTIRKTRTFMPQSLVRIPTTFFLKTRAIAFLNPNLEQTSVFIITFINRESHILPATSVRMTVIRGGSSV